MAFFEDTSHPFRLRSVQTLIIRHGCRCSADPSHQSPHHQRTRSFSLVKGILSDNRESPPKLESFGNILRGVSMVV